MKIFLFLCLMLCVIFFGCKAKIEEKPLSENEYNGCACDPAPPPPAPPPELFQMEKEMLSFKYGKQKVHFEITLSTFKNFYYREYQRLLTYSVIAKSEYGRDTFYFILPEGLDSLASEIRIKKQDTFFQIGSYNNKEFTALHNVSLGEYDLNRGRSYMDDRHYIPLPSEDVKLK